jgi:SAM-dependent methyltransferase
MTLSVEQAFEALGRTLRDVGAETYAYPDPRSTVEDVPQTTRERGDERTLWDAMVQRAVGGKKPVHALAMDAGCGLGAHSPQLTESFTHVLSLDADAARVAVARSAFPPTATHHFLACSLDDARLRAPEVAHTVDLIHCIQVVGHVPVAVQQQVFRTFAGLLRPSGHLIISVPFTNQLGDICVKTLVNRLGESPGIPILPQEYDALARNPPMGVLPVRHFSMGSIQRLLDAAGLQALDRSAYNWLTPDRGDLLVLARPR